MGRGSGRRTDIFEVLRIVVLDAEQEEEPARANGEEVGAAGVFEFVVGIEEDNDGLTENQHQKSPEPLLVLHDAEGVVVLIDQFITPGFGDYLVVLSRVACNGVTLANTLSLRLVALEFVRPYPRFNLLGQFIFVYIVCIDLGLIESYKLAYFLDN